MTAEGAGSAVPVRAFAIRLVALAGIFALAVLSEVRGTESYSERELAALYALVLAGFLLSLAYGAVRAWGSVPRLHLIELGGDALLIAGLVYCSGGERSLFGSLYIIWIVYAALTAGAHGTLLAWAGATVAYGMVTLGPVYGWLPLFEPADAPDLTGALSAAGAHAVAFLAVALLARSLAAQVQAGRAELRELSQIHQRIVDNVASGLLTVNRAGCITSFNSEAERITGHVAADVLGSPLEQLVPSLDAERIAALPNRGRLQLEFENSAGARLHLGMSVSVLRNSHGAEEGAILIFQDLTHVVEMEEQLRRSERLGAVGQLAAGLAHEIRNPLASLSGAIELLAADLPAEDASSLRLAQIVQRETARLNRLVSDFLTYARPGPGRADVVPLRNLLDDLQALMSSSGELDCELIVDVDPSVRVMGNPDQLRQVFLNLVLNAAQAKPEDGRVVVRRGNVPSEPTWEAPMIAIEIIDRGSGVPAPLLERVFEPFFTTRPKGTGLGLATVHRVVDAHGGQLALRSEPGQGTTVTVVLPAAP